MKASLSIVLLIAYCCIAPEFANAQTWLYEKDLIVGDDILRFAVRPERTESAINYHFQLKISEDQEPKKFTIAEGSFKQGAYLSKLVSLQVLNKYKELPLDKDYGKMVSDFAQNLGTDNLSENQKSILDDLISSLAGSARINPDRLNLILQPLQSKMPPDDLMWLHERTIAHKPLIIEKWKRAEHDISWQCDSFLVSVFNILYAQNEGGPVTGMLFLASNPKIWTEKKNTDDKRVCPFGNIIKKENLKEEAPQKASDSTSHQKNAVETNYRLEVRDAQIRFENGQADIILTGKYKDETVTFLNRRPISYSTIGDVAQDYHAGDHIRLYAMSETFDYCFLYFDEVVRNDFRLKNFTDNYSPADTTVLLKPKEPGRLVYKEKITDILQARIYSDLVGLDGETPNGLVQVEISKKVFINTKVREARQPKPVRWLYNKLCYVKPCKPYYAYKGFFQSLTPVFTVSKIEQNNKYYIANAGSQPSSPGDSTVTVSTIDFYRYANLLTGSQLNIYYRGNKKMHYILYADVAAYVMRTGVDKQIQKIDTSDQFFALSNQSNVNSLVVSPLILFWDYRPHYNYRISVFYNFQKVYALSDDILQPTGKNARNLQTIGLFAALKFNEDANGELFFRSRLTTGARPKKDNFFQAQIGYTFKLFSRKPGIHNRPVFNSGT